MPINFPLFSSRLYADLFQSDIIIASPIAIATKLAEDKGTGMAGSAEVIDVLYTVLLSLDPRLEGSLGRVVLLKP